MASILLQILGCLLLADLITGLVHWFEDTYGLPTWPVLGRALIVPNIEHHRRPAEHGAMGRFWLRNWKQGTLAAIALAMLYFAGWLPWQLAAVVVFATAGDEVHSWCHGGGKNAVVRLLHEMQLVITPHQHGRHHKPPFDKTFCTLTNWVNPLADRLRLWRGLEWAIARVGIRPKRMSPERMGL